MDPRNDQTRRWSDTRLTLVIAGIVAIFVLSGMVYFVMSGAFTGDDVTGSLSNPVADTAGSGAAPAEAD